MRFMEMPIARSGKKALIPLGIGWNSRRSGPADRTLRAHIFLSLSLKFMCNWLSWLEITDTSIYANARSNAPGPTIAAFGVNIPLADYYSFFAAIECHMLRLDELIFPRDPCHIAIACATIENVQASARLIPSSRFVRLSRCRAGRLLWLRESGACLANEVTIPLTQARPIERGKQV